MRSKEVLDVFKYATEEFRLCPNRVWAVAGENLPMLMPDKDRCKRHQKSRALEKKNENDDENHVLCTFDFCEYSQRDFTAVQQRHECKERNCIQLQGLFSRKVLTRAAENEESTVWSLDGLSMIKPPRPYMAISHVWSDGTGTGAWRDGEVNECLYRFFQGIAKQFQCDGIWWDTLCIPKEKAARSKAIRKIQSNYENARITLVHDCFLRTWEWDPETACFAILMSPWFSRGWTALELAKSPKVKVIFKGPYGLLIKDLDEEILAKADESDGPRKRASKIIQNLRQGISSLNSLLEVLGQRHTSWPKDRAIISGLLVDVDLSTNSRKDIWQQDVYKGILTKIRKIAPGNLFHNSSTMSKACWCPTSLFDMPTTDSKASLMVTETLDLIGTWRRISVTEIPPEKYNWRGIHALIRMQLELHLQDREKCLLLLECPTSIKVVDRALLVKETRETRQPCYRYIGPVYFHPGLTEEYLAKGVDEEVTLLGDPESALEPEDTEDTFEAKKREHKGLVSQRTDFHDAIWRGDHSKISMDINDIDLDVSDQLGQRPLHLAAERGDKDMVSRILEKSRDQTKTETILDARCKINQTALHRAAWGGSTACVNLLLEAGSKVDTKDKDGNLALHIAAEKGYEPVVELLINKNVEDCKAENENKVTPLHYAAASGQQKMAELLLQNGANVNAKDKYGWSPLHYAAEGGQQNIVDLLLEKGAEVNAKDDTVHWTPLHFAAINGFDAVVRRLRQQENACSGPRDSKGWTPWRFAKLKKHDAVARLLPPGEDTDTDTDTDFDVLDNGRWTVLHATAIDKQHGIIKHLLDEDVSKKNNGWIILPWAAQNGQEAVVRLLLDNGAAIEAKDNAGHTLLGLAAEKGHEAVVRLLLDKGATTDAEDNNGYTPLGFAAEKGHKAVVQLLLNKGTDIEVEDNLGRTPLVLATRKGHEAVVEQLLEKGADIEAWDTNGKTPLMLAAKLGYEEVVQQLLDKGADVEAKGNDYRTPLILAADKGHEAVVRLLLDKGAAVEAKGIMSWTPLMFAAEKGHEAVVRLLLGKGAAIEGNGYKTPLILAADKGHEAVVRLLLDKGAATEAKNKDGHTPLILAAQKGHKAVVRLLLDKGAAAEAKDDDSHMQLLQAVPKRHEAVVQQQQLDKGAATEAKEPPWWDAVVARRGGRVAAARRGHPLLGRYSLRHADRDRVL